MVKYDTTYALSSNAGSSARATAQYIILHDTGNAKNTGVNSAKNEAEYMRGHWNSAYTHAIAGWDRVYLVGEPGYVAYGAGSPANERSPFQIELARYADHSKAIMAYKNWIAAAVEYADKYGIPRTLDGSGKGIKTHKWVTDNLWGDHVDPYAYLASIGISKQQLAKDLKAGKSTSKPATVKQVADRPTVKTNPATVNVYYSLHQQGVGWLDEVKNFGSGSNGFAGNPNHKHDLVSMRVDSGMLKYQVHVVGGGWLGWVSKGDRTDTVNGCAGIVGKTIDAVKAIYITPSGKSYKQAWYRGQTTARSGWLGVVADDGNTFPAYPDTYAGVFGEPLDRLQIKIDDGDPF